MCDYPKLRGKDWAELVFRGHQPILPSLILCLCQDHTPIHGCISPPSVVYRRDPPWLPRCDALNKYIISSSILVDNKYHSRRRWHWSLRSFARWISRSPLQEREMHLKKKKRRWADVKALQGRKDNAPSFTSGSSESGSSFDFSRCSIISFLQMAQLSRMMLLSTPKKDTGKTSGRYA